ncbi:MAG TPA: hypothetical protein EYO20_09650 [Gemmatimonadetes bacterium]|nr:hypothetical protein [Gemmatimonadota bacterium]HIB10079.1 hypothetical protein [Gemmatimonadota bacterium]HIC14119.1 hypothetical protein [Gemmatimonadota bacterium]HIN78298.1 hypothetical protein [Gemmatimonadota bacterium]
MKKLSHIDVALVLLVRITLMLTTAGATRFAAWTIAVLRLWGSSSVGRDVLSWCGSVTTANGADTEVSSASSGGVSKPASGA